MTKTLYFDCFSGASGDMMLGALLDAGFPLDALERRPRQSRARRSRTARRTGRPGRDRVRPGYGHRSGPRRAPSTKAAAPIGHHCDTHGRSHEPRRRSASRPRPRTRSDAQHHHEHAHGPRATSTAIARSPQCSDIAASSTGRPCRRRRRDGRRRCFRGWRGRSRRSTRCRSSRSTCTRSARSTRSSTSSAPCSRSNGSAPTGSWRRRSTSAAARCGRAHGRVSRCRRRRRCSCWPACPCTSDGPAVELLTPTGALLAHGLRASFGPAAADARRRASATAPAIARLRGPPNVLRVFVGEPPDARPRRRSRASSLECEIDDMNPQLFGAADGSAATRPARSTCSIRPVQMKKNRPGTLVTVLVRAGRPRARCRRRSSARRRRIGVRYHESAARVRSTRETCTVTTRRRRRCAIKVARRARRDRQRRARVRRLRRPCRRAPGAGEGRAGSPPWRPGRSPQAD